MKENPISSKYQIKKLPKFQSGNKITYQAGFLPEVTVVRKAPEWLNIKRFYESANPISEFAEKRLPTWGRYSGDLKSKPVQDAYNKFINDKVANELLNDRLQPTKTRKDRLDNYNRFSDKEREIIQSSSHANKLAPSIRSKGVVDMERTQGESGLRGFTNPDLIAQSSSNIADRFRLFPNKDSFFDNYINPAVQVGRMASNLGSIPRDIRDEKYGSAALSVAEPLAIGATGAIGNIRTKPIEDLAYKSMKVADDVVNKLDTRALHHAIREGKKTFKATSDLPIKQRLENAAMSGLMQVGQSKGRDVRHMAMAEMLPSQVYRKIDEYIVNAKPGTVIHGGSMSLDSHPLYLKKITQEFGKKAGIVRTGKSQQVNDLGFKSKYIRDALPEDIKFKLKDRLKYFDEFSKQVDVQPDEFMDPLKKMLRKDIENPLRELTHNGEYIGEMMLDNGSYWAGNRIYRGNLAKHLNDKFMAPLNAKTKLNFPGFELRGSSDILEVPDIFSYDVLGYKKGTVRDYLSRLSVNNTDKPGLTPKQIGQNFINSLLRKEKIQPTSSTTKNTIRRP